jgi:hypothetical protein
MANGPDTPATVNDLAVITMWIAAFGKALLAKRVLTKGEIIEQLEVFRPSLSPQLLLELDNMIDKVHQWQNLVDKQ